MTMKFYRQPRYFSEFRCIGNECPDNCCQGWRIDWFKNEVDKLKSAPNSSPELKEIIERSFTEKGAREGALVIALDENNKCPFQTEDNLCRIQKELGVEYMSTTCMVYPRRYVFTKQHIYRVCYSSCREIMRRLLNDEKSMDLVNVPIKQVENLHNTLNDSAEDIAKHPELKYRGELIEFFYDIIADKKHDVETNIILGALAAQALTKLVESGDIDAIPDALKQFKSQMHNGAQLRSIENIKPNYHLRFGFIGKVLSEITNFPIINILNDKSGTPNIDLYNAGCKILNMAFKDRPFYLRNIALNLLMELAVPLLFKEKTIFENYSVFAVVFACVKLNMISTAVTGKTDVNLHMNNGTINYDSDDKFVGFNSIICRSFCQNPTKQEKILSMLKENKFTSPAYIALLVK